MPLPFFSSARARCALALTVALGCGSPAAFAAPAAATLIPNEIGVRVHLRVVRTTQALDGPQATTFEFDLQRKPNDAVVLERATPGGPPNASVLALRDGRLALAETGRAATADADLTDLLDGLNAALATLAGAAPAATWSATIAVRGPRAGSGPDPGTAVAVALRAVGGSDPAEYDLIGSGQAAVGAEPAGGGVRGADSGREEGGRRGGFPGGGFPGGSFPGGGFPGGGFPSSGAPRGPSGGRPSGGGGAMTVVVRVGGHVSGGSVRRLNVTETRSIALGGIPFVNVASWTIERMN